MGQMKLIRLIIFCAVIFTAAKCQKIESDKNRITFADNEATVVDAIRRLEHLIKKFPDSFMVNYFVDSEGQLYLNNQKIAPIQGAASNPVIINDLVFERFTKNEVDEFLELVVLLMRNGIESAHKEKATNKILFSYKNSNVRSRHKARDLMVVSQQQDTINPVFNTYFKIIDRKQNIVLIGFKSGE
jgi:hypothetical protein